MDKANLVPINWLGLEPGTVLEHKDFGDRIVKKNEKTATHDGSDCKITFYENKSCPNMSYFAWVTENGSWLPITERYWKVL